jgi:hypothetical protein
VYSQEATMPRGAVVEVGRYEVAYRQSTRSRSVDRRS